MLQELYSTLANTAELSTAFFLGRQIVIVEMKSRRPLVIKCMDKEEVDYELEVASCVQGLKPGLSLLVLSRECISEEYVEAKTLADDMYLALVYEKNRALLFAYNYGRLLRRLHDLMAKCRVPARIRRTCDIVEERCRDARAFYEEIVMKACREYTTTCMYCDGWRGHGDPHLYQVLAPAGNGELLLVDYAGEPGHAPPCWEYDVAVALTSLNYIASHSSTLEGTRIVNVLEDLTYSFVLGYGLSHMPKRELLEPLLAARLIYEYYYEKRSSSGLEWIPLNGLRILLGDGWPLIGAGYS